MSDQSETSDDAKSVGNDLLCRDFLRNVCKRGKRCKYHHPDPNEARELGKRQEFTFCHDFQNSGCRRANCKFIHCTREEEEYYKQTGQLPVRLQQAAALGIGLTPNELPLLKGEVPICKDYLKGECKRAGRCKYRHITSTEYEYELRRSSEPPVVSVPLNTLNNTRNATSERYDPYNGDYELKYDYDYVQQVSPPKRRRLELEDVENNFIAHNNHAEPSYRIITNTTDYRLLEEENALLRRKVEELKKHVSDLAATNEVLLEQNARYRTGKMTTLSSLTAVTSTTPMVTVSQVMTPNISGAPSIARAALATATLSTLSNHPIIHTSMPQLTLAANTELITVTPQALQTRLGNDLAQQAANIAQAARLGNELAQQAAQQASMAQVVQQQASIAQQAANMGQAAINPTPVSISPQSIVPVSIAMENIAPPPQQTLSSVSSLAQATLQPSVSMAQNSLQSQNILNSCPTTAMVSYPIMSHAQLPTSMTSTLG